MFRHFHVVIIIIIITVVVGVAGVIEFRCELLGECEAVQPGEYQSIIQGFGEESIVTNGVRNAVQEHDKK